jgi:hypothetical protein
VIRALALGLLLTGPVGDLYQLHRGGKSSLPLFIVPTSVTVAANATYQFSRSGGTTPFTYSIATNNSGGSINGSSGLYTAGGTPATDTVRVTDADGQTSDSTVTVSATVFSAALTTAGCQATLTPTVGGAITFARASNATLETATTFQTCTSDQARVDATAGTLVESASQNEILYSEAMDDASWTTSGTLTVTANDAVGPDGNTVADKLVSTTNGAYIQSSSFTSTGAELSASFWCKSSGSQTFDAKIWNVTGATSYQNLNGASATTTWTRFTITRAANSTNTHSHALRIYPGTTTGQGTLWCTAAQVENNRRWPSSYIKTTSAAVARPRDALTFASGVATGQNFCATFTATPYLGRNWNATNAQHDQYFGMGTLTASNSFNIYVEQGGGNLWVKTWDNAGNNRTYRKFDYFTGAGWVDGSTHSISGCLIGATYPTLYADSVQLTGGNQAGTGLGTLGSISTAAIANTAGLDGWIKNVVITLGSTP